MVGLFGLAGKEVGEIQSSRGTWYFELFGMSVADSLVALTISLKQSQSNFHHFVEELVASVVLLHRVELHSFFFRLLTHHKYLQTADNPFYPMLTLFHRSSRSW